MAKVFVVQDDGRKNLAPALEFGELVVLSTRDIPMFGNPASIIRHMKTTILRDFEPEEDYILCTGDPLLIGIAMALALSPRKFCRCLKWDRQTMKYYPISVEI